MLSLVKVSGLYAPLDGNQKRNSDISFNSINSAGVTYGPAHGFVLASSPILLIHSYVYVNIVTELAQFHYLNPF